MTRLGLFTLTLPFSSPSRPAPGCPVSSQAWDRPGVFSNPAFDFHWAHHAKCDLRCTQPGSLPARCTPRLPSPSRRPPHIPFLKAWLGPFSPSFDRYRPVIPTPSFLGIFHFFPCISDSLRSEKLEGPSRFVGDLTGRGAFFFPAEA